MVSSPPKMLLLVILLPLAAWSELYPGQYEEHRSVIVNDVSSEEEEEILDAINDYRSNIQPTASNMLRMIWSNEAAKSAKNWVGRCVGGSSSEKRIVSGFYCYESTLNSINFIPWKQVILIWYTNHTDQQYRFGAHYPKKYMSSHLQLLSYNTYQVGCAEAFCPASRNPFFYVCHFCPVGYEPKQMPYKRGPPCEDCPNDCVNNLCNNPCKYMDYAADCEKMKKLFNCNEDIMTKSCKATCNCDTEIV